MRLRNTLILLAAAGCNSDPTPVGPGDVDSGTTPIDTGAPRPDVPAVDAGGADVRDVPTATDTPATDGGTGTVAAVRAAITGTMPVTLNTALTNLVVTHRVTATAADGGVSANDPAGFFVQSGMTGPAIFVAVDPATLTPSPVPGDRVAFTATRGEVHAGARWILAISNFQRTGTGADLGALRQDVSAAANLVTALTDFEHELVTVQGTVAGAFAIAGTGFESAQITTAGVTASMTNLRLRVPTALRSSLNLRAGCSFTTVAPLWRFNAQVQVHAWAAADFTLGACGAPVDAGTVDAGTVDAGTIDAGTVDAGTVDVTVTDTGAVDAGTADSGGSADVPLAAVDGATLDAGAEPAPTEMWVVRVGDGSGALSNASTAVFLERMRISDGVMTGGPIALPAALAGANNPLTISGSADSEGQLTRSLDRRFVVLAGYAMAPGTASIASSSATTTRRVVGRVAADGTVNTTTLLGTAFSGNNVRAAASADGSAFWAAGSVTSGGSVFYAPLGATTATPVIGSPSNGRALALYDGTLFGAVSSSATMQFGVFRVDGTTATLLPGFPTAGSPAPNPYGFVAFDRDATPGIDVIYQCDGRAISSGGGLIKWTFAAGTWTSAGVFAMGTTSACRSVTGFVDGANVTLLATTAETVSRVVRFVDTGAAPGTVMATALRSAATNTLFRGIALAPR